MFTKLKGEIPVEQIEKFQSKIPNSHLKYDKHNKHWYLEVFAPLTSFSLGCIRVDDILSICKENQTTEQFEMYCKILESFTYTACFKENQHEYGVMVDGNFQNYMLSYINDYFGTHFTSDEIFLIYMMVGNGVNRQLLEMFIRHNLDIEILQGYKKAIANKQSFDYSN